MRSARVEGDVLELYIDPGTGSMLFAILIGIVGALNYVARTVLVKIRFILSGGKNAETNAERIPFAVFSDNKRYWNVFEPVCREFDRRGIDVVYLTPIHPIGVTNRKGKNNTLVALEGDPGSPYGIGAEAGGQQPGRRCHDEKSAAGQDRPVEDTRY